MNYSEDHIALAAEYALGTLSAEERALVETMMIVDQGFMDVVDAWDRKLSPLHEMVAPVEPPAHLWDKISAAIRVSEPTLAALVETPASPAVVTGDVLNFRDVPSRVEHTDVAPVVAETVATAPAVAAVEAPVVAASSVAVEPVAEQPSNVIPLASRQRSGSSFGWVMTAVAASLAGVIVLQANRPELLPEQLRVKPKIQVVEVAAPATALPAQFVALLQQNSSAPAFILTVDTATKNFTVRKVGATAEPGKSYELWLVSDKLGPARSLGVIGASDFTIRPSLAGYDADTINKATYAVTIEPEGGSPTGVATGPIVYTGKLVESVPALPPGSIQPR